jgi:hypothetical protein
MRILHKAYYLPSFDWGRSNAYLIHELIQLAELKKKIHRYTFLK